MKLHFILAFALVLEFAPMAQARGGGTMVGAWRCYAVGRVADPRGAAGRVVNAIGMTKPGAEQAALLACGSSAGGYALQCQILGCK